jgi:molecular chaperone DnaK (HSP70)
MKSIAENYLGKKINNVAITIPRSFTDFRERLIQTAAALSEFTDIHISSKPNVAYLPDDSF